MLAIVRRRMWLKPTVGFEGCRRTALSRVYFLPPSALHSQLYFFTLDVKMKQLTLRSRGIS